MIVCARPAVVTFYNVNVILLEVQSDPAAFSYRCSFMLKFSSVLLLSALSFASQAANLLTSSAAPPALSVGYVWEGGACPGVGATGFTPSGIPLACRDGIWKMSGIANIEFVRQYRYITAAEVNPAALIEISAFCPAGKKILSGGCNFNGYSEHVDFDASHPSPDLQSWFCGMKVFPLTSYVWFTGIEVHAQCANF